jgi:hypothetical protein
LMIEAFASSTRRLFSARPSDFLDSFGGGRRLPGSRKRSRFSQDRRRSGESRVKA